MISSYDLLKFAEQLGYSAQVMWAKEAASKAVWNSPQSRGRARPLRVDTLLRKEKDGTLVRHSPKVREDEEKYAAASMNQLGGPGGTDFSESPLQDPGQAKPPQTPTKIPSREDTTGGPRREDGRDFATTLPGPGTFLNDTGPQPAYVKTSGLLSNSTHADLVGLTPMLLNQADRLQSSVRNGNTEGVMGEKAHTATDLAGLGVMALPYLSSRRAAEGTFGKYVEPAAVLGGLGALAVPTLDNLQARLRAKPGEDVSSKKLMSGKTHGLLETAGYGTFGALALKDMLSKGKTPGARGLDALHAASYGLLAAPHVEGLLKKKDEPRIFSGTTREATDLLGLGGLVGAGAAHLGHGEHSAATSSAGRLLTGG